MLWYNLGCFSFTNLSFKNERKHVMTVRLLMMLMLLVSSTWVAWSGIDRDVLPSRPCSTAVDHQPRSSTSCRYQDIYANQKSKSPT
ncbi:hypothetical protein K450DRAFT_260331 [Umbelopsis ramanniana AG]|uniref:Uncharacterized protein n=1 Tax=Umbelopsis ramanniana AG TaxID=1314678 RepID=A0AAD5E2U6_UMBRA|nr:uncharacterized protein K450DRAFT_260331 [Umbelopsis ramanniana AG]KAI8575754.1 hypothetical protein K450DRAFT_260331 [Umbelopsis ramanniana AG]